MHQANNLPDIYCFSHFNFNLVLNFNPFFNPFSIHLQSIYNPFTIHLQSIYNPFTIHLQSIFNPFSIQFQHLIFLQIFGKVVACHVLVSRWSFHKKLFQFPEISASGQKYFCRKTECFSFPKKVCFCQTFCQGTNVIH
jgi:hypothetical protein